MVISTLAQTPGSVCFESAQVVWDALDAAGPQGLTKYGITKETGLTEGQVTYAFGFIKTC